MLVRAAVAGKMITVNEKTVPAIMRIGSRLTEMQVAASKEHKPLDAAETSQLTVDELRAMVETEPAAFSEGLQRVLGIKSPATDKAQVHLAKCT